MTLIQTSKTRRVFSRRALLSSLGLSAAFLPLIGAERARAAGANGFPKRLVTVTWGHGVCQSLFYPSDDSVNSEILAPLAPVASKVLVAAGLDYEMMLAQGHNYDGHFSYPVIFTGTYKNTGGQNCTATGPSLDQVYADAVAKQVTLKQPLLAISVQCQGTSFRAGGQRNTGEGDAKRLFDTLFSSAAMPPADVAKLRQKRQSVLDLVATQLQTYQGRLGTDDQAKIAAHLDSVRQLEKQLTVAAASCGQPATKTTSTAYQDVVPAMMDIAAMALRCDLTRSVSIAWADDGGGRPVTLPWAGINSDLHAIAHQGANGYAQKKGSDLWMYQQVASLAKQLDSTAEGSETVLDHSVIVVGNDMNEGSNHFVGGLPFVLIGSAGGYLKTGRTVRLGSWAGKTGSYWNGKSGVPHNQLLATLSNALDMPTTSFGEGYDGTLDQLKSS